MERHLYIIGNGFDLHHGINIEIFVIGYMKMNRLSFKT